MSAARLRDVVARFAGRTVVVVGDLIVDEYLFGRPARISREAPVLILRFTEREISLGGAANAQPATKASTSTSLSRSYGCSASLPESKPCRRSMPGCAPAGNRRLT